MSTMSIFYSRGVKLEVRGQNEPEKDFDRPTGQNMCIDFEHFSYVLQLFLLIKKSPMVIHTILK